VVFAGVIWKFFFNMLRTTKRRKVMKNRLIPFYRIIRVIVIVLLFLSASFPVIAEEGCRTGASALGNAYVRLNPIYAYFYGNLESYVESNREHFVAGGDSIRCAQAMSQALITGAIQSYDPDELREKQELDARLGALGIAPGPYQATASQQLYAMGLQVARLARVLPSASNGNYQPLYTATNQLEEQQIFAAQMLVMLLQDPTMAEVFTQLEPLIREAANSEYQLLVGMALSLVAQ
jgi:hypothetical protein